MPRVKGGYTTRRRRKAVLKLAKGFFGSKRTLYRTANEQVMRSLAYSFAGRKQRKREFRKLWITRINAACKQNDIRYSRFVNGLKKANITINRKMLSDLAITDAKGFTALVDLAKKALNGEIKPVKAEAKKEVKVEAKKEVKAEVKAEVKEAPKAAAKEVKAEVKAEAKAETTTDLESLKVAELKEMAKAKGITGYTTMKKAELIAALK